MITGIVTKICHDNGIEEYQIVLNCEVQDEDNNILDVELTYSAETIGSLFECAISLAIEHLNSEYDKEFSEKDFGTIEFQL